MLALSLLLALAAPPTAAQGSALALRVDRIVRPDGTLGAGGWIVVRGGRLEVVGAAAAPPGVPALEFAGGVACPGFIDAVTALGAAGDLDEPARAFTPEVLAADAFHADHVEFLAAARGGITTVGLSPGSSNVVGGRLAIVRTSGEQGIAVLGGSGPLRLTLTADAFDPTRAPTSRMGALPKLRELLASDALKSTGAGGNAAPLVVDAGSPDEIRVAIETLCGAGKTVALLHPRRADDALDVVTGKSALAIMGPFGLDTEERDLRLPQALAGAGIPVAFTANGDAGALRLTAAVAVRAGFAPVAALQALTTVPARILGVENDSGTLEAGKDADVVVTRGDLFASSAVVERVYVDGAAVVVR